MSYSVSIRVKVEGVDKYLQLEWLGNITWNVRELIEKSSGWEIENESSNGNILPWLEKIRHGICELEQHPEEYKEYESPNGWGTVEGTLRFYRECVKNAESWMGWCGNEELIPIAVIYVD